MAEKNIFFIIKRIFRLGWQGLARDGAMIAANIFVIVMALSVVTSLFLFRNISQFLISSIQEKVDVSVYFKEGTKEEDILEVKEQISIIPQVKEVSYVSKEQALETFIEKHRGNPILMESLAEVGTNPFLASLGIKAFQAHQYEAVVGFLERPQFDPLIEKIDYFQRKPVIERIDQLTSRFNRTGIIFSIILIIIASLTAFNTVRLSIYNSREEIKIQRLVGASNWFIRGPFLVQGAVYGLFSALICFFVFFALTFGFNSKIELLFPGLNLFAFFVSSFWLILSLQLLVGIGLSVLSSLIATKKYLKV